MKLKLFANACVLVEHVGVKVLCDPWFTSGAYYGSWWQYPQPKWTDEFSDLDYIYISHVHPDHFDPVSLALISRDVTIIICEYEEKFLLRQIQAIGFKRVIELPNHSRMQLARDFFMEMYAADDVNAELFGLVHHCPTLKDYRRTLQIDSLAVFEGGGRVLVNCNDVPFGLAQVPLQRIKFEHPHIDCALVSYAGAGPFPQSYDMTNDEKDGIKWNVAMGYLTNTTLGILKLLDPMVYIPFAAGYVLGGKNVGMNPYKGVCELDDLADELAPIVKRVGLFGEMVRLDYLGTFDLSRGDTTGGFTRTDIEGRSDYAKKVLIKAKFDYEIDPEPVDLGPDMKLAYAALKRKQERYGYFSGWSCYVDLGDEVWRVRFDGEGIERVDQPAEGPHLISRIDKRLMRRILDRKANWNNAEVGCHILLKPYAPPPQANYEPMLHFLMPYFQVPRDAPKVAPGAS